MLIPKLRFLLPALLLFPAHGHALPRESLLQVQHIIVISMENHSFDNLFGTFPGANGIAGSHPDPQLDDNEQPYATLPVEDKRLPQDLPNAPFLLNDYVSLEEKTTDPVHRFLQEQFQINDGKMDKFVATSDARGLVMGYYDTKDTTLWSYARQYTLADNFFHAAFGGSFLNHLWLICACTPRFENAPEDFITDEKVTPDGYAVNTLFPVNSPHPAKSKDLLPIQDVPTIGDRLSEKDISWKWYSGGWNDALAGKPDKSFAFHHQPFAYFKRYADATSERVRHLQDEVNFIADLQNDSLPAVVFYKPLGKYNMHPGKTNIEDGDNHLAEILKKIQASRAWDSSVVIITFDENGGFWDHVPPPKIDRWGPGTRVPTLIISPFAKKGYVDHTNYDTTSILKFIEERFDLAPLSERDAKANSLSAALDL